MKRLTEDLKRMLNALALQDAADYLPMREKMRALGGSDSDMAGQKPGEDPPPQRRVALLSDGGDSNEALQFALNACANQRATLDLVLYGVARDQIEELRQQLQAADLAYEIILLGEKNIHSLIDYLDSRRSLTYLIASADNSLALKLTKENSPHQGGRLHLPMVLVDPSSRAKINRINSVNAA
ncbi:MAG: hypothetical protein OEZ16_05430 [Chromatiales bacterium]|nr:hypothetical protein [Chromatiales bacterium]